MSLQDVNPSIVLDMRYFGSHNFLGTPAHGYHKPKCLLTHQAADALTAVQASLRKSSLSLKVYDCYRPQQAVNHFVAWAENISDTKMKGEFYPTVDKKNLFRDGYIASRSGHSRGSTVDLTIVPIPTPQQPDIPLSAPLVSCTEPVTKRFKDNSLDMGTGFDCFDVLSHTNSPTISPLARINRELLKSQMEQHGFENYPKEWWHYTLKNEPFIDTFFDFPIK